MTALPVLGLRPVRSNLYRVAKVPKPANFTVSPHTKALSILEKIEVTS